MKRRSNSSKCFQKDSSTIFSDEAARFRTTISVEMVAMKDSWGSVISKEEAEESDLVSGGGEGDWATICVLCTLSSITKVAAAEVVVVLIVAEVLADPNSSNSPINIGTFGAKAAWITVSFNLCFLLNLNWSGGENGRISSSMPFIFLDETFPILMLYQGWLIMTQLNMHRQINWHW